MMFIVDIGDRNVDENDMLEMSYYYFFIEIDVAMCNILN